MQHDKVAAQQWHKIDWKVVNNKVELIQSEICQATIKENMALVYRLQRKLIASFEGRAKAVRKVIMNSGGKTPGIDNIILSKPAEYYMAIKWLKNIVDNPKEYKAKPIKRILIPKPGKKEKRPLGIPTINDRTVQAVYHLAMDPVVECKSDLNSFGFRKTRSTHDAINYFRNYMDKKFSPGWVLEADISKCFDKIDHRFLMDNTPICDKHVLKQWLSSGMIDTGVWRRTEEGTPQGSIISPLLCNITLNGLEETIKNCITGKPNATHKIKIIRYADDIVITGRDQEILEKVLETLRIFLKERGLALNNEKTRITKIEDGIDLLGFNIRRQRWSWLINGKKNQENVLVIKPSEKGIINIKNKIKEIFQNNQKMEEIVAKLNPMLRGWAEHKRITPHARRAFFEIDNYIWERLRTKFIRSKPGQNKVRENFRQISQGKGRWGTSKESLILSLARIKLIRIKLKQLNMNPYKREDAEYFAKFKLNRILTNVQEKLYRKYKDTCEVCKESLLNGEAIEIHHVEPVKKGGTNKLSNLIPLHKICHAKVTHEKFS